MTDALSRTFAPQADPTRPAILARVSAGDAPGGALDEAGAQALPAISKHLTVLERAGLVTKSRDGQRRHCRISVAPLQDATSWLELYRKHWEEQFDNLGSYLATIQQPSPQGESDRNGT